MEVSFELRAPPKHGPLTPPDNLLTHLAEPLADQPEKSVPGVLAGEAALL
jgi:hypothetical protein